MRLIDRRLGLLFCFFVLLFSVALARAFWLQGVRGGELRAEAHSQQVTEVTIPGQRGRVIDRTGKVLAVSEDAADIIATPYQVKDPERTAERLHDVTGVSVADLTESLSDRSSGFAYLARKVDLDTADRVERLQIAGISTVPDSRRLYPQGELASQVIGAVGTENQGLTGLEQAEDDVLGGANGEQEVVHDALGEPLRTETVRPASIGQDVRVTLDAAIQGRTEEALAEAGEHFEAKGATAIVMDPSSGDILAMANWPGYDPTDLESASDEELANRATGFTYEPGSTFKAFTVAAALEDKVVTPQTSFYLPSEIQVADREDRGGPRATADRRDRLPDPRPVVQRRRGEDRARGGRRTGSRTGSTGSASVRRPASTTPARSRGSCRRSTTTRARRWATSRSARGSRSLRCRWRPATRRSPTAACCVGRG